MVRLSDDRAVGYKYHFGSLRIDVESTQNDDEPGESGETLH